MLGVIALLLGDLAGSPFPPKQVSRLLPSCCRAPLAYSGLSSWSLPGQQSVVWSDGCWPWRMGEHLHILPVWLSLNVSGSSLPEPLLAGACVLSAATPGITYQQHTSPDKEDAPNDTGKHNLLLLIT